MGHEIPDPYRVLGVPPSATQTEITHAYRTRLRAHHPDTRTSSSPQSADDRLRQVLAAYELLRNPARRADYDHATADAATAPPRRPPVRTPADRPRAGPVEIPISYRHHNTPRPPVPPPPLRAGPVRRHR